MVPFIQTNQLLRRNSEFFAWPNYPTGISAQIPVPNTEIINSFWLIPVTLGNRVIGYEELVATDSTKPTPDSVKVLRVKNTDDNTVYEFAIVDTDNISTTTPANEFAFLANGLGGSLPVMPTVTIPTPIMQSDPQSVDNGDNTFVFAFPVNASGLLYAIPYPWFNGVAPSQAYEPAGITTAALFVTWANTSGKWDGFGTWANPSTNIVTLVSTASDDIYVLRAGMQITLTATHFCLTLNSSPDAVNGIKINNAFYSFPAISAGRTNRTDLINAIRRFLPGATFTTLIANKIDVLTTQTPQAITKDEVTVSGLTWGAGACS